jgi:hypothetical protein
MDTFAEGFIAPCVLGRKEKRNAYLLYNENAEDIVIESHFLPNSLVSKGGKLRIYGKIITTNNLKELSVESYKYI